MGGYLGQHFEVYLEKDNLLFFDRHSKMLDLPPKHEISVKDDDDWYELIKYMETLNWKRKYFDNNIIDGTQWELFFISENKKLECFGSNEYPTNFDKFVNLLKRITKKHYISTDDLE
jgi:hypothetical protein